MFNHATPTDTRNPIPDTRSPDPQPNFSAMLNQAAAALADCMLNLTAKTQADSGKITPVKLRASRAAYMTAQTALMQARAVEASLRALAHYQKIQASYTPPEEPRDYAAEARMVEMWALADDADRTARINARVRLAAEAKYAQAKTDAEIDALGKVSLEVPLEDLEAIEEPEEIGKSEEVNEASATEDAHLVRHSLGEGGSCPPQEPSIIVAVEDAHNPEPDKLDSQPVHPPVKSVDQFPLTDLCESQPSLRSNLSPAPPVPRNPQPDPPCTHTALL